jgi:hypothetical protein
MTHAVRGRIALLRPASVAVHHDSHMARPTDPARSNLASASADINPSLAQSHSSRESGGRRAPQISINSASLAAKHLVHILNVPISQFLHSHPGPAVRILTDFLIFKQRLELIIGVPTDIADRHLGAFALMADYLDQIAAAFFGQRRQWHPNRRAAE